MGMSSIKDKVIQLIDRRHLIPDEFWVGANGKQVVWFLDQEDGSAGDYETSQERLGITRDGEVMWGFSSGCSCWDGWQNDDYCPTRSWKEFEISDFDKERRKERSYEQLDQWEDTAGSNLDDFLFMVSENPDPKRVLQVKNAEIRRYMIKRVGYEEIKDAVNAKVIHKDGDSELLEMTVAGQKERYVKVKDSSTDREYLLYVPNNIERCRQGIAWTFDLSEDEYSPLIET